MKNVVALLTPEHRSVNQKELIAMLGFSRQSVATWTRAGLPRHADGTYSVASVMRWLRAYYAANARKKYEARLALMRRKVTRNVRQLERFLAGKTGKIDNN